MAHCQSQGAKAKDLLVGEQVKEQSYTCKSKGLFGMAVVAALSMMEGGIIPVAMMRKGTAGAEPMTNKKRRNVVL